MGDESWETTREDVVEVYRADDGWRWRVIAPNREITEQGESYRRRIDAVDAAERHHPRVDVAE